MTESDHDKVSLAVASAETRTDGEIVTVVAAQSDAYHDVALHWATLAMLGVLAVLAFCPGIAQWIHGLFAGGWDDPASPRDLFTIALFLVALKFLGVWLVMEWHPLRLALTPPATKARRVRRRALDLFRTAAEARTQGKTGVLLYLSVAEHRAEIIADEAIHSKVEQAVWGEAMAALIVAVRDGRPGDGMADAVAQIGAVLAEHLPRSAGDTNELPDRLIEL